LKRGDGKLDTGFWFLYPRSLILSYLIKGGRRREGCSPAVGCGLFVVGGVIGLSSLEYASYLVLRISNLRELRVVGDLGKEQ
jgi:hypothetical protein